jgi:cytochrome c553
MTHRRFRLEKWLRVTLLVLAVAGLVACSDAPKTAVAPANDAENYQALLVHGRQQSRMCLGCHGPRGVSHVKSYPSLAGKPQEHLARELMAFREGTRENPLMSSVVKSLSDRDIQALSLYYSQQNVPPSVQDHAL